MKEEMNEPSRREFIKSSLKGFVLTIASPTVVQFMNENNRPIRDYPLIFSGAPDNDLFIALTKSNIDVRRFNTPQEAIEGANEWQGVIISANDYPHKGTNIAPYLYTVVKEKKLRLFIEYPEFIPEINIHNDPSIGYLQRGIITSDFFGNRLPELSLLGLHDCYIYPIKAENPLISFAKVAGFDRALYGLKDTNVLTLLFQKKNIMIATSSFTLFKTARYGPSDSWKILWEKILSWLKTTSDIKLSYWESDPRPSYKKADELPINAKHESIYRGADWIFNAHFLIHQDWKDVVFQYLKKDTDPYGSSVGGNMSNGDGSLGILEGHSSIINYDGTQKYRYGLRADVQGETAFLLASAGHYLSNERYALVAKNLIDYVFHTSIFRQGKRNVKDSSVYGLLSWTYKYPHVFYADDNARAIMGIIGASAFLKKNTWDKFIVENILANFRLSSRQGFFGGRLQQEDIMKKGWKYYNKRDFVYYHPHYESWMWACYLWLYNKTGYKPLLDKAKIAIRLTMEAYPDEWGWQNGIQQEKARMILPLAWLVQVEDTPQHRGWLKYMVDEVVRFQQSCGAIREELGANNAGVHSGPKSNNEYGQGEAPLISENGQPVSDMLYTCNFAFFALNEAANATRDQEYFEAANKLSDFLTRIQIKSERHKDLDGGWFRAFEYHRWEYWASNADAGWGTWCTLTGWIQSWIVATQVLLKNKQSYWELTKNSTVDKYMEETVRLMFENELKKEVL